MSATAHLALPALIHTRVQHGVFCAEQDRIVNHNAMHILHHLKYAAPDTFPCKEPVSALSAAMGLTHGQIPALAINVLVDTPVSAQRALLSVRRELTLQGQLQTA
jgi:hypothetical protein